MMLSIQVQIGPFQITFGLFFKARRDAQLFV